MSTALVTGASSGIGRELAKLLAEDRHDVVLAARHASALEELGQEISMRYRVTARSFSYDLSDPTAPADLFERLGREGIAIDVLVNDAGFGVYGPFSRTDLDGERRMIQVNVVAVTELAKRALPWMLHRRRGAILNVASTAAFQPGPLMAVYYATKAYVLSFSEALANELNGSGVTVTALCPGPTRTRFQERAGLEETRLFTSPLVFGPAAVARAGYEGMKKGKRVVVPGWGNKALVQAVRLSPRRMVTAITRRIQESRSGASTRAY